MTERTSQLVFDIAPTDKARYVRAARPGRLDVWVRAALDQAATRARCERCGRFLGDEPCALCHPWRRAWAAVCDAVRTWRMCRRVRGRVGRAVREWIRPGVERMGG
jgi:hypothetical protein